MVRVETGLAGSPFGLLAWGSAVAFLVAVHVQAVLAPAALLARLPRLFGIPAVEPALLRSTAQGHRIVLGTGQIAYDLRGSAIFGVGNLPSSPKIETILSLFIANF